MDLFGPSRDPACESASIPVIAMSLPANQHQPFDFRSSQFGDDAQTLSRATGLGLEKCRQELFIAEGDVALAYDLLTVGYGVEPPPPTLH